AVSLDVRLAVVGDRCDFAPVRLGIARARSHKPRRRFARRAGGLAPRAGASARTAALGGGGRRVVVALDLVGNLLVGVFQVFQLFRPFVHIGFGLQFSSLFVIR